MSIINIEYFVINPDVPNSTVGQTMQIFIPNLPTNLLNAPLGELLEDGRFQGQNSVYQRTVGGEVPPYEGTPLENITIGRGSITLGEANYNEGNRTLLEGRLLKSKANNSIIAGLLNGYGTNSGVAPTFRPISGNNIIAAGQSNANEANNVIQGGNNNTNTGNNTIQGGSNNTNSGNNVVQGGYRNANVGNNNAQFGSDNEIIKSAGSSIEPRYNTQTGKGLKITDKQCNFAAGRYNLDKADTLLEVGNGTGDVDNDRSNAFEVTEDGVARAYGNPVGPDDLVPKRYLDGLVSPVYRCEYGVTLYADIVRAISDGLIPVCEYSSRLYIFTEAGETYIRLSCTYLETEETGFIYNVVVDINNAWDNDSFVFGDYDSLPTPNSHKAVQSNGIYNVTCTPSENFFNSLF